MSPVWNQPSAERARVASGRVEVAAGHVLAADEDLAVLGDLHFDAGDRLADRPRERVKRVIERDDRRGLGEAVALDDHEAEPPPERLELGIERRRADDDRPELEAEHAVDAR